MNISFDDEIQGGEIKAEAQVIVGHPVVNLKEPLIDFLILSFIIVGRRDTLKDIVEVEKEEQEEMLQQR
ncbi:hypothetical protein LIER_37565 [Lithospermum erythrorhizon]|uniref:Uncharacterized protein n=1 Tax=Lithospermum erythrorhizon TaxID=34254 RepID=A0AAV3PP36_LITER